MPFLHTTRLRAAVARLAAVGALAGALAAPLAAGAQEKEPGGLNKVARDVSSTVKKAGRDTKAETKRVAGRTHRTLQKAGNDTKAEAKRVTGVSGGEVAPSRNPGGLNKLARDVSKESKRVGRRAKRAVKRNKAEAHADLTRTGNEVKASVKGDSLPR